MSLNAEFVTALRRVTQRWRTRWDAELRDSGQTLARARALMILSQEGGSAMQRDLAAHLSVEHPTLVRLLDSLEGQGLIRREPVPGNARANRIALTPAAAPMVEAAERVSEGLRQRVLGDIPREDLETALRVLRSVATKLETLDAVPRMAGDGEERAR
ncbi:MarR family winged helix-turn-helix transcriptional regulator [Muricoccus pecuniae]|uniref:MarR family transcriptional regulator for hemolysin n=1 Tax=Muricoccus pecuniae TaxID=693023 RepID=A0A840Y4D3_9PROT|nr:MarR family transcriptional regulator [Roseomonas pecuniae]MBB5693639.1 MarR family transcriptional regulator for hemolysin [Roseomonas pecuniae]